MLTIAELPFIERPVIELLALDVDRDEPDPDYAGYGFAKIDRVMLVGDAGKRIVEDALLVAVHSSDDGEVLANDIELELDLPDGELSSVTVLASRFLEVWLPKLPNASAIVLVMCNPHRARLAGPAWPVPIHYALGDVESWQDLDDPRTGIRLVAETWCTLGDVSTELARRPDQAIDDETKQSLAGIYLMKKIDLKPEDGGMELPVVLPSELSPIDEVLQELAVEDYVVINAKKDRWDLTKKGLSRLKNLIDEAEEIYDAMDEIEEEEVPAYLAKNRLDPVRTRFLWGWYEGELDDLVQFQEQRGLRPVEKMWAFYLMGDDFWRELAKDVEGD
jgi:hypothetical protein